MDAPQREGNPDKRAVVDEGAEGRSIWHGERLLCSGKPAAAFALDPTANLTGHQ